MGRTKLSHIVVPGLIFAQEGFVEEAKKWLGEIAQEGVATINEASQSARGPFVGSGRVDQSLACHTGLQFVGSSTRVNYIQRPLVRDKWHDTKNRKSH